MTTHKASDIIRVCAEAFPNDPIHLSAARRPSTPESLHRMIVVSMLHELARPAGRSFPEIAELLGYSSHGRAQEAYQRFQQLPPWLSGLCREYVLCRLGDQTDKAFGAGPASPVPSHVPGVSG